MTYKNIQFDEHGIKRIIAATKRVEQMPLGDREYYNPPVASTDGFYAKILGNSDYKYSWEALKANAPDHASRPCLLDRDLAEELDSARYDDTNDRFAVEVHRRSPYVPKNSIVYLRQAPGQSYYLFEYEGRSRYAMTKSGGIPAMSGSTSGKAQVSFWRRIVDNVDPDTEAGDVQCYNDSTTAVKGDTRITIQFVDGSWTAIVEDC